MATGGTSLSLIKKNIPTNSAKKTVSTSNNNTGVNLNDSVSSFIRQMSNDNNAATFNFNHNEAVLARDWQREMSDTSHQREVEDLKRAGLNPVLSANSGATAYGASSASGSADSTGVAMLASIYNTRLNNANAVKIAKINQDTQKMNNKKDIQIAKINKEASKYASDNAYSASKYATESNALVSKYASDNAYISSRYASDQAYNSSIYSTDHNKYSYIDQFVKGLIGSNDNTSTYTIGKRVKDFVKKLRK